MNEKEFLKFAIEQSELSVKQSKFPAGAVVVLDNKAIALGTSDIFPGYQHAECRAIDKAFQKAGKLTNATLYASMEPCLMCLARAYWSGIRNILFAIPRKSVSKEYYEGSHNNNELVNIFNEKVQLVHVR